MNAELSDILHALAYINYAYIIYLILYVVVYRHSYLFFYEFFIA